MDKAFTDQLQQVGQEIKRLREEHLMTQQTLADECSVDIRTIQRIEKGEFGFGLNILFAIAMVFDMHPSQLIARIVMDSKKDTII